MISIHCNESYYDSPLASEHETITLLYTLQNSLSKGLSRNNKGRNGQGQNTQMEDEEEEDESSSSSSIAIPPIVAGVEKQQETTEEESNVEVG